MITTIATPIQKEEEWERDADHSLWLFCNLAQPLQGAPLGEGMAFD